MVRGHQAAGRLLDLPGALANHKNAGGYFIHAYGNNKRNLVAHTTVSVAQAVSPQVWTQLSADGRYMTVTLTGRSDLSRVWFPVWSAVNGQDDLQWYEAKKQSNGDWTYTVTLARHKGAGTYFIHVYGIASRIWWLIPPPM